MNYDRQCLLGQVSLPMQDGHWGARPRTLLLFSRNFIAIFWSYVKVSLLRSYISTLTIRHKAALAIHSLSAFALVLIGFIREAGPIGGWPRYRKYYCELFRFYLGPRLNIMLVYIVYRINHFIIK